MGGCKGIHNVADLIRIDLDRGVRHGRKPCPSPYVLRARSSDRRRGQPFLKARPCRFRGRGRGLTAEAGGPACGDSRHTNSHSVWAAPRDAESAFLRMTIWPA